VPVVPCSVAVISEYDLGGFSERLDTWYARSEDDVLMYGRGSDNVVYLGDWMIERFPLARACDNEPLRVSDEMGVQRALDRAIQAIQRHKQVYSNQLHPLLCALTSAELVAYSDQSLDWMSHILSGNFRSMLIDIFGRSYPEHEFFMVDRDAVARYKARVHANVALLCDRIEAMLTNVVRVAA